MYLIGDNFYIIEEIRQDQLLMNLNSTALQMDTFGRINSIQPTFLVLAIIFFRAGPYAIELICEEWEIGESMTTPRNQFMLVY